MNRGRFFVLRNDVCTQDAVVSRTHYLPAYPTLNRSFPYPTGRADQASRDAREFLLQYRHDGGRSSRFRCGPDICTPGRRKRTARAGYRRVRDGKELIARETHDCSPRDDTLTTGLAILRSPCNTVVLCLIRGRTRRIVRLYQAKHIGRFDCRGRVGLGSDAINRSSVIWAVSRFL